MSSMENFIGQAWDEFIRQQQGASPSLNGTLEDLWHKIAEMESPTPEEEEARVEICADLTERLASLGYTLGGTLAAEPHGSFLMGCFTSSSTLEVAVTGKLPGPSGQSALVDVELRSTADRLALLERVHSLIADCGVAAQGTVSINRTARVPSVSFEHASSGIPVRVCIAYPNFALRPQVVRGLVLLEPQLRSLIQLVELWADAHGLNNPATGTFNSWALVNLVIFAAQTFQSRPLLPPLWRACGGPDPAAGLGTGPGNASGVSSSGFNNAPLSTTSSGGGGVMALGSLSGGGSMGGAMQMAVRPMQRLPGLTASSEGLAPVLRDIHARLAGPPEALGLPARGQSTDSGLLPIFKWFLVLLDRLMAQWQLSWNRRWRVSTWWGQLVQQPFNRAFLVPVECPFDPADNAAKSLGCENQSKHQQVLRGIVEEVSASLRLLQDLKTPEGLDRLVSGMFGLEVEHLYLEEEEEEQEIVEAEDNDVDAELRLAQRGATAKQSGALTARDFDGDSCQLQEGNATSGLATTDGRPTYGEASNVAPPPGSSQQPAGASMDVVSSPVLQVRLLQTEQSSERRRCSPALEASALAAGLRSDAKPDFNRRGPLEQKRAPTVHCTDGADAGRNAGPMDEHMATDAAINAEALRLEGAAADGTLVKQGRQPLTLSAAQSPALLMSSAAAITAVSPAVLRANARVQRPLSPLLRDVTNARTYGQRNLQGGPEPKAGPNVNPSAASTSVATSATESPGGESLLPFESLFGSFLKGARRLFDNMAQGMAELGEDLNELAATTAATIRAVINDDEDLPFLGSSAAALRRQRRQRLQLLHRGAATGAAAPQAATSASPASISASDSSCPSSQSKQRPPAYPGLGAPGRRAAQRRASPLRPGEPPGGSATLGRMATPGLAATPGTQSPLNAKTQPRLASPDRGIQPTPRGTTKRRGEGLAAELEAAAAAAAATATMPAPGPPPLQRSEHPGSEPVAMNDGVKGSTASNGLEAVEGFESHLTGQARQNGTTEAATSVFKLKALPVAAVESSLGPGMTSADVAHAVVANGSPVMLLGTPVRPSEHPLACSPVTDLPLVAHTAEPLSAAQAGWIFAAPVVAGSDADLPNVMTMDAQAQEPVPGPAPAEPASEGGEAVVPPPVVVPLGTTTEALESEVASPRNEEAAGSAVVPLVIGLLRLESLSIGSPADYGLASTCGTSTTLLSTATADASLSTASSPTAASSRSLAPTPPRKAGSGQAQLPARGVATDLAPDSAVTGDAQLPPPLPPPPPPPLPPSLRPAMGMGGLRVKSATFRKGAPTRDAIISPTANAASSHGSSNPSTTTTNAAAAAAFITPATSTTAATGMFAPDAASRGMEPQTLIQLSSGRLQELAECIDRAGPYTTIDLQGNIFSGPLAAPAMKVTAPGLRLMNGVLALSSEQQLVVVAKAAHLIDITVRDMAPSLAPAAAPQPRAATAVGGAIRPALLVTKQSYVGGGELTLRRCPLLLGLSRGVGLQVKGKGCSAVLEDCTLCGSAMAAAQASDAALSLSRCILEDGTGHGVWCRDNAAVTATDCRIRRFGGACVAVLAGGSVELLGCKLSGAGCTVQNEACEKKQGGAASVPADPELLGESALPEGITGGGGEAIGSTSARPTCGPGVLAEGKGSSLVARGSSFDGFRSQAALFVTAGASVSLEDCHATASQQGAVVGTRGGRLMAVRCELSSHMGHGLAIGEGATTDLRDCRLLGNGAAGLQIGGVGSMAVLRGCELSGNARCGMAVAAGGCVNLDTCIASANGIKEAAAAPAPAGRDSCGNDEKLGLESEFQPGHGLLVEGSGARVTALRCTFSCNAGAGIHVGAHGSVQLSDCGIHGNNVTHTCRGERDLNSGKLTKRGCCDAAVTGVQPGATEGQAVQVMRAKGVEAQGQQDFGRESDQEFQGGVQVQVEAYGRVSLLTGRNGDGRGVQLEHGILVAELGCLEWQEDG